MQCRPLIFVVISVFVGALVYSSISAFNVFAVQRGEAPPDADCETNVFTDTATCCWTETDPGDPEGIELYYCQVCSTNGCNEKFPAPQGPTPPPSGPAAPLQGGVLEQPPTPPPFDPTDPLQGGVLEQQDQQTPSPTGPIAPLKGGVLEQLEQGNFAPGFTPGFLRQQEQLPPADQGAADLPPPPPSTTEETQPATVEEEQSVCQEGLEFNEDLGFCVPEDCPEGQVLDEGSGICVLEEPEEVEEPAQSEPEELEQQQTEEGGGSSEDNSN